MKKQLLPKWFTALDYDPSDTNGDGIPDCWERWTRTYCVGWDHYKVNTRNLPVISTNDWRDAVTDHCLALEWSEDKSIDLASYLNNEALEIIDRLHFTVNGSAATRNYSVQDAPEERAPIVLHVQVFAEEGDALDSLWIVVYKPSDKTQFDDWYADQSTTLTWTTSLAKPCHSLVFSGGKAVRNSDVYPYIRSLLLDGNPSPPTRQWIPQKLVRPPLFQGGNAGKYLTCRPTGKR